MRETESWFSLKSSRSHSALHAVISKLRAVYLHLIGPESADLLDLQALAGTMRGGRRECQGCFFADYRGRCSKKPVAARPFLEGSEHFLLARTKTIPNKNKETGRNFARPLLIDSCDRS